MRRIGTALLGFCGLFLLASGVAPAQQTQPDDQTIPDAGGYRQFDTVPAPPKPKTLLDEVPRGETVEARPHPDYDPIGQRVGPFMFYPGINVRESFESNILGTKTNALSDFITSVQPSVDLRSDWKNSALNFHADDSWQKYTQHSAQDYNDYTFNADGRLDIMQDAQVSGAVGYSIRHQPVYSPNNPAVINPNLATTVPEQYSDLAARITGLKTFNRLSLQADVNYDDFHFFDVTGSSGVLVPLHLEDYDQEQFSLRTSYELAPSRQIYLLTTYNLRNHDFATDLTGVNRSSTGFLTAVGFRYDLTGITFLDVYGGYMKQDYQAPLPNVAGPTAGAKLTWNVTRLTTITGSLDRDIAEAIIPGISGYFDTRVVLRADHELMRNVILNGFIGFEQDDFVGATPSGTPGIPAGGRTDYYYRAGAGARYLISRNLWLSGGYTFQSRISNQGLNNFNDNIIFLTLGVHL